MNALTNKIILNLKYYGFWVSYFVVARFLFLIYHFNSTKNLDISEFFYVLIYGLRLDFSIAAYVVVLPFLMVLLGVFTKSKMLLTIHQTYSWLMVLLMNLLLSIDLFLYSYWNTRLDTTFLRYLNTPELMFASVNMSEILVSLLCFSALSYLTFRTINYLIYNKLKEMDRAPLWSLPLLFLMIGVLILPIRGGLQTIPINQSNVYFSNKIYANHAAVNYAWNFMHAITKHVDADQNLFVEYEPGKALTLFDTYRKPLLLSDSIQTPVFKTQKPNVILIIWEGFTGKIVGPMGGDSLTTPYFNKYIKEGLFFSNFYANGDRTDKGLVSLLSGYYPQPKKSIIKMPMKSKKLPLLSQSMKLMGYHNSFYYGGDLNFGNMNTYLYNKGIDEIYGSEIFERKDWNSKWGVHDHVLFDRIIEDLKQNKQYPFFKTILTLTSHEPYEFPGKYRFGKNTETNKFKSSMAYTDKAFGDFVAFAKTQDWWDNSLIIITADHGHPLPKNEDEVFNAPSRFKIPMLWLGGALANTGIVNDNLGSQVDLTYTLIDLLGGDNSSFEFGTHLFNSNEKQFVHYVFNEGFGTINNSGHIVYDFIKKDVIQVEGKEEEILKSQGKAILQTTYQDFLEK
ncbi:MAG: LTA synthase family protein [Flavobacteriaceae bacterium]